MKTPNKHITAPIGQINGSITWNHGQVPISLGGTVPIHGHIIHPNDAIKIEPVTLRPGQLSGGEGPQFPPQPIETPISGFETTFNHVSVSGQKVSVSYTISKLPIGVEFQLNVTPRQVGGTFVGRSRFSLDTIHSVLNGVDFVYQEPPIVN